MGREKVHMVLFGNLLNNPLDVLYDSVVQLARTLACHARGRGFKPPSESPLYGSVAQRQSARLLSVMSRYRNSPEPPPPRANVGG